MSRAGTAVMENEMSPWKKAALALAVLGLGAAQANPPLAANERVQGTLSIDVGQGAKTMRSIATVVDAQLGEKTAARLATAEGQRAVADAQARVAKINPDGPKISAQDVQATAQAFAGRTMYSGEMRHIGIIKRYQLSLSGVAADGSKATLNVSLDDKTLAVLDASVDYHPDGKRVFDFYTSSDASTPAQVKLTKLEKLNPTTYAVAGTFSAPQLVGSLVSKKLKGQTLGAASGQFNFTEVALRAKP
jgi:hypothetical protein